MMKLFHAAVAIALSLPACNQAQQVEAPAPEPVVSEEEHEEQHRRLVIDGSGESFSEDDDQDDLRDDDSARPTPTPSASSRDDRGNSNQSGQSSPTPGSGDPRVVEFRIKSGTGQGAWNDASQTIQLKVGQTLRIVNEDNVTHQLHTNGLPCGHGRPIRPGQTDESCRVSREYNGPALYDHISRGAVHIRATR